MAKKHTQAAEIPTQSYKDEFLQSFGLCSESSLQSLLPALDLTLACIYDIPHSEWKGLGQVLQELLYSAILTPHGLQSYYTCFQAFIPPVQ